MRFRWPDILSKSEEKETSGPSTLEKHWGTIISLTGIFILALFVRSFFAFELATKHGVPYLISGGSDAYYYGRIINYIQANNHHLLHDPLLNFPVERTNPRPPFYAWSVVLGGYLLSPFVDSLSQAISYVFILSTAIWGALTIFPVYLIGRDTFGKKAGMTAAFLLAISAGHLQRSPLTNGDHDALYLFFAVTAFYFFMKSLEGMPEEKKWVSDWFDKAEIKKGLSEFISNNKKQLLYAGMSGMAIATVALTWKGYAYVIVIILAYFIVQLFLDKLRERDSLGVTAAVTISVGLALLVAAPFYVVADVGQALPFAVRSWYDVPLLLFLGAFGIGVFFTVTRDLPWLLIFSIIGAAILIFVLLGVYVAPGIMKVLTSGAGYFTRTKAITTIAEAQAPQFSKLILSFGMASFFLSILGIALAVWRLKGKWTTNFIFIILWTALAIYMAMSAARFIFNSSPAFALTAGWILALVADKTDFAEIARRFRGYRGDIFRGIYEGVKVKHILTTLFVVFLIMTPNALYAFDAGIPMGEKSQYNDQIHQSLPEALQGKGYNETQGGNYYLGAFGYNLDEPTNYWPAAWDWFKKEDADKPPEERPGFLSWWDYGFECAREGDHPTVADNFLSGHRLAGNVLMAQNESEILALLITRSLKVPYNEDVGFEGETRETLVEHLGEEKTERLEEYFQKIKENPDKYDKIVRSDPKRYHPRAEDLHWKNIKYALCMGLLSYEKVSTLHLLYKDITDQIDKRIEYLAVDSRLFPISGRNTGIFYAPAKLSGHRISSQQWTRTPPDFYDIKLQDAQGNTYDSPEDVPQNVQVQDYKIDYKPMFYNSTLYKIFVGYSLNEVGESTGIPGLDSRKQQPRPGWNMSHFKMAYRTAYYNPYPRPEYQNHTEAWRAISVEQAREYQKAQEGTVDMSAQGYMRQGVVFLEYYHGAIVEGKVTTEDGRPISNAKITVLDGKGTTHDSTRTDENGSYRVIAPSGNTLILASNGGSPNKLINSENIRLKSLQMNISEDQAMRKNIDKDGDGRPDYLIQRDMEIETGNLTANVYLDEDNNDEYSPKNDSLASGDIKAENVQTGEMMEAEDTNGSYQFTGVTPGKYTISTDVTGTSPAEGVTVKPGKNITQSIKVSDASINGSVKISKELEEGAEVVLEKEDGSVVRRQIFNVSQNYSFSHLIPGRYSMKIENDGYALEKGGGEFVLREEELVEYNISVKKADWITGQALLSGDEIPNQKLSFTGVHGSPYNNSFVTDGDGKFSAKLPNGIYRVYGMHSAQGENYVDIGILSVPEEKEYTADFKKGFKVNGEISYAGEGAENLKLFFDGDGGSARAVTNTEGNFSLYLPRGGYNIYGRRIAGAQNIMVWEDISVDRDLNLDLDAIPGLKVTGITYRDLNHNGEIEPGEGTRTTLNIASGNKEMSLFTKDDGNYSMVIPSKRTDIEVEKEGFKTKQTFFDPNRTFEPYIPVRAKNVTVQGELNYENNTLSTLPVQFERRGRGAMDKELTVEGTSFKTDLRPGRYRVKADYKTPGEDEKYSFSENIEVPVGAESVDLSIPVKYGVRVNGSLEDSSGEKVSAEISFQGPEQVNISADGEYEVYLRPGKYRVRAKNVGEGLAVFGVVSVYSPTTNNITLQNSITLELDVEADGKTPKTPLTVNIEETSSGFSWKGQTNSQGIVEFTVAEGKYKALIDQKVMEPVEAEGIQDTKEFHYHGSGTYILQNSTTTRLLISRERVKPTLQGQVTIHDKAIKGVELRFIASSPFAIDTQVTTGSGGSYSLELAEGVYTIYAKTTYNGVMYATFQEFAMGEENGTYNMSLSRAAQLSGKVVREDKRVQTDVKISKPGSLAQRSIETDEDGSFQLYLPKREYKVEAKTEVKKDYGYTTYRASEVITLDYDDKIKLSLKKVKEYGISIDKVPSRQAKQGEKLTYYIGITNTGNTRDEYKLSAKRAVWDLNFSTLKVRLNPDQTREIKVTVKVKNDSSVNHPPINFKVESLNSTKVQERTLDIEVEQVYGVVIDSDVKEKAFEGGTLTYTISVKNTGNGRDSFNMYVLNRQQLRSKGWNVSIENVTGGVKEQDEETVKLKMRAISKNPNPNVKIKVKAVSKLNEATTDVSTVSIELPTMSFESANFTVSGDKIALEKDRLELKTWHWVAIVITASIAAVYVLRKKRWI